MLLLDEPSNDLDVETLRALEDAVEVFPGTVMVVSSGMALGPEGPMIHSGAIIGSALTRVGADTFLTRSSRKIRQNLASSQAICRCS